MSSSHGRMFTWDASQDGLGEMESKILKSALRCYQLNPPAMWAGLRRICERQRETRPSGQASALGVRAALVIVCVFTWIEYK
eukprot:6214837-Pleurochrysis_carterae.AAC.8